MPLPARPVSSVRPDGPASGTSPIRRRRGAAVAGLLAGLLVLAGCVAPRQQTTPEPADGPSAVAAPEGGIEGFYGQDVSWETCGEFECATVQAPLDWDAPEAGAIELALQRSAATGSPGERLGSLLVNPGGPGTSGIEFVQYATTIFGERLLEAYDVVGFDPRGVGSSTAVRCGDDALLDAVLTADMPRSQADLERLRAATRELGEQCLEETGPLLGEIDTVSAARDLDLLRAVLGDDELYYAGFSYGTRLGATYADLHPDGVGRMLLDGALDPTISGDELIIGQAAGFEDALRAYVADCQSGEDCPLHGDVQDGVQQVADLMTRLEGRPLDAGEGHEVNATLAFYGVAVTLYDDATWPYLTQALTEALQQNRGSLLLQLANIYLDRTPDGTYTTNSMVALNAINCLDYPPTERDYEEMKAFAAEVATVAPTFARNFVMGSGCEAWPFQGKTEPTELTAPGASPILVVGTTGDPATPYEWSLALAEQLEPGHLLTYEGEGHTAYGRSNACVSDAVEDYLVEGRLPPEGLVC